MNIEISIEPRIIAALKHIASKDETRYVLQGINIRKLDGRLTFTATNGSSLASIQGTQIESVSIPDDLDIIIPTRIPHKLNQINIDTDSHKITYLEPGQDITLKLIEGKYPNFLSVIPEQTTEAKHAPFGVHHLEEIMACAKAYAKRTKLNDDAGLYCLPQGKGPSIFALGGYPEWFAMLMPRTGEPTIPNWLKKK